MGHMQEINHAVMDILIPAVNHLSHHVVIDDMMYGLNVGGRVENARIKEKCLYAVPTYGIIA